MPAALPGTAVRSPPHTSAPAPPRLRQLAGPRAQRPSDRAGRAPSHTHPHSAPAAPHLLQHDDPAPAPLPGATSASQLTRPGRRRRGGAKQKPSQFPLPLPGALGGGRNWRGGASVWAGRARGGARGGRAFWGRGELGAERVRGRWAARELGERVGGAAGARRARGGARGRRASWGWGELGAERARGRWAARERGERVGGASSGRSATGGGQRPGGGASGGPRECADEVPLRGRGSVDWAGLGAVPSRVQRKTRSLVQQPRGSVDFRVKALWFATWGCCCPHLCPESKGLGGTGLL